MPDLDAILHELDQLTAYARTGRQRPFVPTYLTTTAVAALVAAAKANGTQTFKRARRDLLAAHALTLREAALQPIVHTLHQALAALADGLAARQLPLITALIDARTALDRALTAAFAAGAQALVPTYTLTEGDHADLAVRLADESQYLLQFFRATQADTLTLPQRENRLTLWTAQTRGAYEAGKGAAVSETETFVWVALGDRDTCAFCAGMDGQTFTRAELDAAGWPADGTFGVGMTDCAGGARCRCTVLPSAWLARGARRAS